MEHPGRIRDSVDLLGFALKHAPSRACQREIVAGRAEVLGGFTRIQPFDRPGWLIRVLSRHGRTWIISVEVDEVRHSLCCRELDEVPWADWIGHTNRPRGNVYDGDHPHEYAVEHELASRPRRPGVPRLSDHRNRNRRETGETR